MNNIIVTGAGGQLGTEIINIMTSGKSELGQLSPFYKNCNVIGTDIDDLDISDLDKTIEFIEHNKPYAVVNCAAMTNVDGCETNIDGAFKANAIGPRNLAIACEKTGSKILQVSTDYVFDGLGSSPYIEADMVNPNSVYGASKNLGEKYVREFCNRWFITRTAWLYGYKGNNFVKTIAKLAKEKGFLKVVNDQVGNPTNAADLAWHICKLIITDEYGIYHCTGRGECSWYDFACEIVKCFNLNATVEPCSTEEFPRPANRPKYSSLDNLMLKLTIGDEFRHWKDAIKEYSKNVEI